DVDFFYDCAVENVERLYEALLEFWEGDIPGIESRGELSEPGVVVQFGRPPNRIDLHSRIDGVTFEEAWQSRVSVRIECGSESVEIDFIGLEPLRKNKQASARAKDLDDLEHLPEKQE